MTVNEANYEKAAEVQDNRRENQLADLLDLRQASRRIGDDATDEFGNSYESKSTTVKSVGTSRDVGRTYTNRMRQRYLIVAFGRNNRYGFAPEEIWALHPEDLDEWISNLEAKILADEEIAETAIRAIADLGASKEVQARLRYLCERGATYNNPKISMDVIRRRGTLLEGDPALSLRRFVSLRPLAVAVPLPLSAHESS